MRAPAVARAPRPTGLGYLLSWIPRLGHPILWCLRGQTPEGRKSSEPPSAACVAGGQRGHRAPLNPLMLFLALPRFAHGRRRRCLDDVDALRRSSFCTPPPPNPWTPPLRAGTDLATSHGLHLLAPALWWRWPACYCGSLVSAPMCILRATFTSSGVLWHWPSVPSRCNASASRQYVVTAALCVPLQLPRKPQPSLVWLDA
ncbi:hypothetical protein VPH35_089982 [Triticum aestivum]